MRTSCWSCCSSYHVEVIAIGAVCLLKLFLCALTCAKLRSVKRHRGGWGGGTTVVCVCQISASAFLQRWQHGPADATGSIHYSTSSCLVWAGRLEHAAFTQPSCLGWFAWPRFLSSCLTCLFTACLWHSTDEPLSRQWRNQTQAETVCDDLTDWIIHNPPSLQLLIELIVVMLLSGWSCWLWRKVPWKNMANSNLGSSRYPCV